MNKNQKEEVLRNKKRQKKLQVLEHLNGLNHYNKLQGLHYLQKQDFQVVN